MLATDAPAIDVAGIYDEALRRGLLVRWETWTCKPGEVVELHFPGPRSVAGHRINLVLRVSYAVQQILAYGAMVEAGEDFPDWDSGMMEIGAFIFTTPIIRTIAWIERDFYPAEWGEK